jgi:hypothetical protein
MRRPFWIGGPDERLGRNVGGGTQQQIMSIKRKAGGFRNPSNFTTAIYFHCGGLDPYPR